MVEVTYEPKKHRITAKGHADYAEAGKDIVCSAVSCLLLNLADYVERYGKVRISDGFIRIESKGETYGLFDFVYNGLRRIEEQYPDNIHLVTLLE